MKKIDANHLQHTVKYGQGLDQVRAGAGRGGMDLSNSSYAMFSHSGSSMAEVQKSQELRRRPGTGIEENVPNPGPPGVQNSNPNAKSPSKGDTTRLYNSTSSSSSNGYGSRERGGGGTGGQYMQMQLQQRPERNQSARLQGTEKVEKALTQVRLNNFVPSMLLFSSCTATSLPARTAYFVLLPSVKCFHAAILIFAEVFAFIKTRKYSPV